jgi:hypothetical protein
MDEATLAVVGSIAAALLGSFVGATINQRAALTLERRREAREADTEQVRVRAAARLVFTELQLAQLGVTSSLENKQFVFGISPPGTAWATHGVLLAGALSEADYDIVSEACGKVAIWFNMKVPALNITTPFSEAPEAEQGLRDLSEKIAAAIAVLHPVGYPESAAVK